ncbi:hypothetical protein [Actinacidiphila sp. bgisy144]|uniref:hypothetical protein n=1 Tax=Actinacidiphila sp. bgisy144 TaxID=3413791 RepID=UPI003EBCB6DC
MDTTPDLTAPHVAEHLVRLAFINEQSRTPTSLSAQWARTVLTSGDEVAWMLAYVEGGKTGIQVAERVIAFMRAVRTERFRYWTVSYSVFGKDRTGSVMAEARTARAQHEWAARRPGADDVRITEYTDTLVSVPVDPDRLPRDEDHRPPAIPGAREVHRFYRYDGEGPAVLPSAAAVARARRHLLAVRPRRYALPPVLLDTVRVVAARTVAPDEITPLP